MKNKCFKKSLTAINLIKVIIIYLRLFKREDLIKTTKWFNDFEIVKSLNRYPLYNQEIFSLRNR